MKSNSCYLDEKPCFFCVNKHDPSNQLMIWRNYIYSKKNEARIWNIHFTLNDGLLASRMSQISLPMEFLP